MTERSKKKKRPRDTNQLAKAIVDEATCEEPEPVASGSGNVERNRG